MYRTYSSRNVVAAMFCALQGWWPLGQSYCDTVIDGWLSAALQEWRHGSSILQAAQPQQQHHSLPAGVASTRILNSSSSSSRQQYPRGKQLQQRQRRLPSWVQRAVGAGLLDPKQQFDPTSLSSILCSCNPELKADEPVDQAHAVDAALNTATAPAAQVASAAGKAAVAAAGSRSGGAKYSWLFGLGRAAAPQGATTPGSALPGIRGEGAWEPFGQDSSAEQGVSSAESAVDLVDLPLNAADGFLTMAEPAQAPAAAAVSAPTARRGWWGSKGGGGQFGGTQAAQAVGTAQLRSKL